jgi:hypothetical protein
MTKDEIINAATRAGFRAVVEYLRATKLPLSSWNGLPIDKLPSAYDTARDALEGLTPSEHHNNWCYKMRKAGWVWGQVHSASHKITPALSAYIELPTIEWHKDNIFWATVRAVGLALGWNHAS